MTPGSRTFARGITLAIALASFAPRARAGNDDGVLLGNEAAMAAGAVTATVSDGSGTWYNPAGLARVQRATLDLSGSATMLRIADTPALLRSTGGAQASGSYYEFLGIPSAVTMVRVLEPRLVLGLGIFVPEQTGHTDNVSLTEEMADSITQWQLAVQQSSSTYYAGITLAYEAAPTLRIGATLFGTYRQNGVTTLFFGGETERGVATTAGFARGSLVSQQSVSIELGAGLQWDFAPEWTLGVSLRSPGLLLGSLFKDTTATFDASDAAGITGFGLSSGDGLEPTFDVVTPARLRAGIVYRWRGGSIAFDGDVQHELDRPGIGIARSWVGGARVGALFQLTEEVRFGAGVFTDLDATRNTQKFGDTLVDFFGATAGFEIRSPHVLGSGERAPDLVFVNTFALRYAFGLGKVGGRLVDRAGLAMPDAAFETVAVDTFVNEISLHLGSAVLF